MKTRITVAVMLATFGVGASFLSHANDPVWDGNIVELISEELQPDVFAYYPDDAKVLEKLGKPVATSGGFIIGNDGVLLIDTMLNKRLNNQVQELIRNETDKPILFAVNTSFHGDHSYGNMYLPDNTTIIQHSVTKAYIDQHFQADTEFMIQNFGQGRGIEEIRPVTGDILVTPGSAVSVDLGGKRVDIIDFGFAQTGGDLFVWEPDANVLWTGNPIITVKPSLPWLLDGHLLETLESIKKVYEFLPDDAQIVPGHGSVMEKGDIQWHIDYLETVKSEVQEAIDEGLTLEQTVERVKMPEFGGYALFGWVHPGLNVPAAYKDLSQ